MKLMKAAEAAKGFGRLVDEAQAEPVTIERNGRPVAVVYSYREAQQFEALKLAELKRLTEQGIKASKEGRVEPFTSEVLEQIKVEGRKQAELRKGR